MDKLLYKGTWQVVISKEFLFNSDLSGSARLLFIVLKSFCNDIKKQPFPSKKYLSKITGYSERKIFDCLKELEIKGFLKITNRRKDGKFDSNIYELNEPSANLAVGKNTVTVKLPDNINQYISNKPNNDFKFNPVNYGQTKN